MWTVHDIESQLEALGLSSADTVCLHTSMRAVGPVEGGAEGMLRALTDFFADGLVVIPTHTWATVKPEAVTPPALPTYDVRHTLPCIGILPTVAAFHPEGVRSMHATHSVACFGRRAREYAALDDHAVTPAPPEGCFGSLYAEKARILLIGVGQERHTFIHAVEEVIDVPERLSEPYTARLIHPDGREELRQIRRHFNPICAHISENFVKFDPFFERAGAVTRGTLGSAAVQVCDAVKCQDTVIDLWKKAGRDLTVDMSPIEA